MLVGAIGMITAMLVLVGCDGSGSVTLPTSRPTINVPSVTVPRPTLLAPTSAESATVTQTQTATQTATQTQTVTASPTAPSSPSAAVAEPSTVPATDAGPTWWRWVLVLIAAGAAVWLVRSRQSRQKVIDEWDGRLRRARTDATWVEGSLVGQVLSHSSTAQAEAVWLAARERRLEIDELLHALTLDPPDEQRAATAAGLRERFSALVEAVSADVSADPADSTEHRSAPDDFRARRVAIDTARSELRAQLRSSDVADAHR